MNLSPIVIAHLATVVPAVAIGAALLFMRKGTALHRFAGRSWAVLMLATALISFGIQTSGHFSWIHLLSLWVIIAVTISVRAAMLGNIRLHRRFMRGVYAGTLVAAAFTLLPQRELGKFVWQAAGLL